jgi:hypothetical protein
VSSKQRTWGQYATPPQLADLLLGYCLRRPADRLLDPSCGDGALLRRAAQWQRWLASAPADLPPTLLTGVELDEQVAVAAQGELPQAHILAANFFTLQADMLPTFDAVIGNPPYTRAEWIGRLNPSAARQLPLPAKDNIEDSSRKNAAETKVLAGAKVASLREKKERLLVPPALQAILGGRAGLHAYFFLHGANFLRENGRLGFIVPNGWLDVAYGQPLKQFLLDHFRLVTIIESSVERWFDDARVNTCLVVLEKCASAAGRKENLVRLVQLTAPLQQLLGGESGDYRRVAAVEGLVTRLLPAANHKSDAAAVRVQRQGEMAAGARWGTMLRAPAVYFSLHRRDTISLVPLKNWAFVRRGFTTGANDFFYLDQARLERWGIERAFRRPALKSLRHVHHLRLNRDHRSHDVLTISASANLRGTAVACYLDWAESEGIHLRRTCSARPCWYALAEQTAADLVLAKGIWQRHFSPILDTPLLIDQQLYGVYCKEGVPLPVAAALLNSTWFALQCELQGRVNFGEGVLWLASYELEAIRLPDPRQLTAAQAGSLAQSFARLAERPLGDTATELDQPDRRQLDEVVFDVVGLAAFERAAVYEALFRRIATRTERANSRP